MDILSLLFSILFRSLVVILPLTTGWLALRRLMLSHSANAWYYAASCLFAAATVAGLLPWALGIAQVGWLFFVLAAFCPAIWIGVVIICDASRGTNYDSGNDAESGPVFRPRKPSPPLVLENPDWPGAPIPVFRHNGPAERADTDTVEAKPKSDKPARSLLTVARDMRTNATSDARRPRRLPAPDLCELPFLTRT